MTKKEVWEILRLIESVYPFCITKDETVMTWFKTCEYMEYDMVIANLLLHVKKSPYPPTIASLQTQDSDRYHFDEGISRDRYPRLNWQHEYSLK